MILIACPSCGYEGKVPDQLLGKKIKCQICNMSFQAAPPLPSVATPIGAASVSGSGSIELEVHGTSDWIPAATVDPTPRDAPAEASASTPPVPEVATKRYKVLTQKDRWFEGKFDLGRLEEALNHYASQGWVVRAMSTPHVKGFSGGPQEEIVVLLER